MKSYKVAAKLIETKLVSIWIEAETKEEAIDALDDRNFEWDHLKDEHLLSCDFKDIKVEAERDMELCKFCKEHDLAMNGYYHKNEFVCHNCRDERLRCTE